MGISCRNKGRRFKCVTAYYVGAIRESPLHTGASFFPTPYTLHPTPAYLSALPESILRSS
ncbi:MAG: hypothetical protein F6J93_15550 [Oscillatoria sp. SIO1A7]|nr:hypothetical protein [Oscillatoria sp. SIO1A7]